MKTAAAKKPVQQKQKTAAGKGVALRRPQVILLSVTGMTPAVLTETVWALAHENPAVIPDRVIVITTPRGHEQMQKEILTPVAPGQQDLWQILREGILGSQQRNDLRLNLEVPRLITAPNPRSGRSEPLEDFRTSAENAAMADFLLEQIRGFVETPDVQLITSIATNSVYRLPTEAEWEYACRAWTSTRFSHGEDVGYTNVTDYAWYRDNNGGTTHAVGQKLPNPWGLYDTAGNVWEWCQDWSAPYPGGTALDPQGPATGVDRVLRGASVYGPAYAMRSAQRFHDVPTIMVDNTGLRVVLAPGQP